MSEIFRDTLNRLTLGTAGVLLSGIALNACASDSDASRIPEIGCTVRIVGGNTLSAIAVAAKNNEAGQSLNERLDEIKAINSGVRSGNLTPGDELALSNNMCDAIDANTETDIHVTPFPPKK
ncbi:MAG: hypothetical protein JWM00_728 [Candidatus Saccharibacteria bacterium]|nr:hypothetical protein [Candidatus Saccharibacteria bacterium]